MIEKTRKYEKIKEKIKDEKTRVEKQGGKQERDHGVRNQADVQLVK